MFWKYFLLCTFVVISDSKQLKLEQVLILSRHNVRTPLSKTLSQVSPKPWPVWNEKPGYLTPKGVLLEGYMGEYFSAWLHSESVLPKQCPTDDNFYAYANTAQRTMESAKSFVRNAFPDCSIIVHHANKSDPVFNPFIHNSSASFLQEATEIMKRHIKEAHLNSSYLALDNILDYKNSENCLINNHCDLIADKNKAFVRSGMKPAVNGPLKISKSVVDSFLMENYEGLSHSDVAWGMLETKEQWDRIMDLSRSYHDIIFNTSIIAKDISQPLIKYFAQIVTNKSPKVTLIMGHDANLYTVLNALNFEPYNLDQQYEKAPIGGKIVFQKWSDEEDRKYLKVHYVYQSTEQMRNGIRLSLENPPIFQLLKLKDCEIDENGFCDWNNFINILNMSDLI